MIEFRACSEILYNKFQLGDKRFYRLNQIMDRIDSWQEKKTTKIQYNFNCDFSWVPNKGPFRLFFQKIFQSPASILLGPLALIGTQESHP